MTEMTGAEMVIEALADPVSSIFSAIPAARYFPRL